MKRIVLIFMVVLLGAYGCKSSKNATETKSNSSESHAKSAKLTETKWLLTHLDGTPVKDTPEQPYIIFTGDRVTGSLGCNTFFGTFYANKKGKLDIEYTGSTKKLCNEMDTEYQFISAMKSEKMMYTIKDNILSVKGEKMDADGVKKDMEIMRFKADR